MSDEHWGETDNHVSDAPAPTIDQIDSHAGVISHMNMLQGVITRLAGNSASCKTWCVAVVGGLLAVAGSAQVPGIAIVAFIPVVVFAFMDSMYLAQERLYRGVFAAKAARLRDGTYEPNDLYDMETDRIDIYQVGTAMESWSVAPVYLMLLAACLLVAAAVSFALP